MSLRHRQEGREKAGETADLLELPLGDTVSVEDDAGGLEACGLVELDEKLAHHGRQVLDDLLPVLLDAHGGAVAVRVGVHAAHDLRGSAGSAGAPRVPALGAKGVQERARHMQTRHLYDSSECVAVVLINVFRGIKVCPRDLIKKSTIVLNP